MTCVSANFSKAISVLRFPMAVLVVAIHWMADLSEYIDKYMSYAEEGLACFYFCYRWLVNIAVPTFFLFSGYLLFAKTKLYSWGEYKVKLKIGRAHV